MDITSNYNARSQKHMMVSDIAFSPRPAAKSMARSSKLARSVGAEELQEAPRRFEQTMNLTVAFNKSIYSAALQQQLGRVSSRQFSSRSDVQLVFEKPGQVPAVDFQTIRQFSERLRDSALENARLSEAVRAAGGRAAAALEERQQVDRRRTEVFSLQIQRSEFLFPRLEADLQIGGIPVQTGAGCWSAAFAGIFRISQRQSFLNIDIGPVAVEMNCLSGPQFARFLQNAVPREFLPVDFPRSLANDETALICLQDGFLGETLIIQDLSRAEVSELAVQLRAKISVFAEIVGFLRESPGKVAFSQLKTQNYYQEMQNEVPQLQQNQIYQIERQKIAALIVKGRERECRIEGFLNGAEVTAKISGAEEVRGAEAVMRALRSL